MNENKVPGIWKWTVILLMACNVGLMLTIWLKPRAAGPGGHGRPEQPRDYVIRNLNFTREQVKQYDKLIQEHRHAMDELKKTSRGLRKQMFANIKNEPGGPNIDSLAQLIAGNQKEIELVTFQHFAKVRADICTETQKPELDRIIDEVTSKMNGGMRGGPRPNEGDDQGPPRDGDDHRPHEGPEPPDNP